VLVLGVARSIKAVRDLLTRCHVPTLAAVLFRTRRDLRAIANAVVNVGACGDLPVASGQEPKATNNGDSYGYGKEAAIHMNLMSRKPHDAGFHFGRVE